MKSKIGSSGFLDKAVAYGLDLCKWTHPASRSGLTHMPVFAPLLEAKSQVVVKEFRRVRISGKSTRSIRWRHQFSRQDRAAARLNSPVVRIVMRLTRIPEPTPPASRREVIGWVIENLRKLTPHAEIASVRLVIENHGDLRIAEIERILDEVNSPWLGVQFDLLEQVAIFEDPNQAAERLLPHAFTVHWNDAYAKLSNSGFCVAACPPGQGIIDLDGVFKKIASLSQDVFIFTAFQADSDEDEDELVKAYLDDLHDRQNRIHSNQ
jgi:sugar phosphate isomerase/epimerase